MKMLIPALIFLPLMSLANPSFTTLKSFDGAVEYCHSKEDLGKGGVFLENTNVTVSPQDASILNISLSPQFYRCTRAGRGYKWQPSNAIAFLSQKVRTAEGIVRIVPTSYDWVVYSDNYTELNPQPGIKGGQKKYSVKIADLLSEEQKSQPSRAMVTVFLKYRTKAVYPNGEVMDLGTQASGSFNILINLSGK